MHFENQLMIQSSSDYKHSMMQAPKNTKCNMVYKDYKRGLYLLELFILAENIEV